MRFSFPFEIGIDVGYLSFFLGILRYCRNPVEWIWSKQFQNGSIMLCYCFCFFLSMLSRFLLFYAKPLWCQQKFCMYMSFVISTTSWRSSTKCKTLTKEDLHDDITYSGHAHLWYHWPTCTIENALVYPTAHSISCCSGL